MNHRRPLIAGTLLFLSACVQAPVRSNDYSDVHQMQRQAAQAASDAQLQAIQTQMLFNSMQMINAATLQPSIPTAPP